MATASRTGQHDSGGGRRRVESASRALKILLHFSRSDAAPGLGVSELARALELSKSSISRLLGTLTEEGFTIVDPDTGRYHIGPSAFAVGSRFAGANLARIVQPILRNLADQADCTAQFGMLQGDKIVYLAVVQGSGLLRVVARPGDQRYAHGSAMGKAIFAALSLHERRALVRAMVRPDGLLPPVGPGTVRDPERLLQILDETAARGFSTSEEEAAAGVSAVGASVPNAAGIRTALSIAVPTYSQHPTARALHIQHVTQAASAAGRLLGAHNTLDPSRGGRDD